MTALQQKIAVERLLADAIAAHQAGQHVRAEQLYLEYISKRPGESQAHYLLGALYHSMRAPEHAFNHLNQANALRPDHGPTLSLLGVLYSEAGEPDKALRFLGTVAAAHPQSADAQFNFGRALLTMKCHSEASAALLKAISLNPNFPSAINCLATCRKQEGRVDEAIALLHDCIARAPRFISAYLQLARLLLERREDTAAAEILAICLKQDPNTLDALLLLGNLKYRQQQLHDAEILFRRLVTLAPLDHSGHNYLGSVLMNLGLLDEAEERIRNAYRLSPNDPEVLTNLGLVLDNRGRSVEAISYHRRATELRATMPEAWNNLGLSLQNCGMIDDAIAAYERASEVKPDFYVAKANAAHALMATGRLAAGWRLYRHRFDQKILASKRRDFPYPEWRGQTDRDARLLLWTDQGLGDEVLYASMIPEAQSRVGQCTLECYPTVVPLFQRSFPDVVVIGRSKLADPRIEQLKPHYQLPLIELGELFRATVESIPRHRGYLKPDPDMRALLRSRYLAIAKGRKIVGISWKSENPNTGRFKTLLLPHWGPVLKAEDVLFVSLQYGQVSPDIAAAREDHGIEILHDPEVDPLLNPDASAAQIAAMDLVITTSNTTAHFAGALHVPVWTMVPVGAGILWYWFLTRTDSPWYPSMRLFRQTMPGNWSDVVGDVASNLRQWIAS